jgi:hypothetical protein
MFDESHTHEMAPECPMGRPMLCRQAALAEFKRLPRVGRNQVRINARTVAKRLGCHRTTVGRMIDDLVAAGQLRRLSNGGKMGVRVLLIDTR